MSWNNHRIFGAAGMAGILGVVSLALWALILVVTVKYVLEKVGTEPA